MDLAVMCFSDTNEIAFDKPVDKFTEGERALLLRGINLQLRRTVQPIHHRRVGLLVWCQYLHDPVAASKIRALPPSWTEGCSEMARSSCDIADIPRREGPRGHRGTGRPARHERRR